MRLPCAKPLAFIVTGLASLKPGLTNIQFTNMAFIATALVLGSGFNLSRISRMWLEDKVVSTLSFFLSDAKFSVPELQLLYAKGIQQVYGIQPGYFLIDDTMKHHSKFCKWIHGVFVLFDHALGTNLKATCAAGSPVRVYRLVGDTPIRLLIRRLFLCTSRCAQGLISICSRNRHPPNY
jgi:hypothetical protein